MRVNKPIGSSRLERIKDGALVVVSASGCGLRAPPPPETALAMPVMGAIMLFKKALLWSAKPLNAVAPCDRRFVMVFEPAWRGIAKRSPRPVKPP